jgi:hypothetical protein
VQATTELENGASKVTKNGYEEGKCNTNKAKEVKTEEEQEIMRRVNP